MKPDAVHDAVVLVDVARRVEGTVDIEVVLIDGAQHTIVAAWDQPFPRSRVIVAERSPDRMSVAVLVGSELTQVDLPARVRTTIGTGVDWPDGDEAVLAWGAEGPEVVVADGPGETRVPLADGRVLAVTAPLWCDDGFSGGDQGSAANVLMPREASRSEFQAAVDELDAWLQEQALVEHHDRVVVEGPHAPAVLLDERTKPTQGRFNVHWPISVGRSGVIVRTSTSTTRAGDHRASDTTIGEPWFVGRDGSIERIPTRLGNAPLCELPDGRWLMPGHDELWCDAGDEPVHALGRDGSFTHWAADREISTVSLLGAVAPELLPSESLSNPDDGPWFGAARVTADARNVVLLVTGVACKRFWDEDPVIWAVMRLRSDGRGDPALIVAGQCTADRFTAVAL